MSDHRSWQRATALRKVAESREGYDKAGVGVSDQQLASAAAAYVGVDTKVVLDWMKGAA